MNFVLKPLFAITLFLSAFLLFSVQPMIGKTLLPVLGGSPSVWNTAMVFFQVLLLAGYFYAFLLSKISSLKVQGLIHGGVVLLAAAISLPLALKASADVSTLNPMGWQLVTMSLMIAAPFFALASSAPLLQRWFSLSAHDQAASPYSLYVASNAGSLLALLAYPIVIERMLRLGTQAEIWSLGYGVLAVLMISAFAAAGFMKKTAPVVEGVIESEPTDKPTTRQRLIWTFLAFVPSSLMIGYTTYVTTDATSLPLFWVLPLAFYLVSFIMAFAEKPFLTIESTRSIHAFFVLCFLWFIMVGVTDTRMPIMVIHGCLFFFTALLCHQELAKTKPNPAHLTEFYLFMSLGGALGGLFNSLLAPLIFPLPYEYLIAIMLGVFARGITDPNSTFKEAVEHARYTISSKSGATFVDFIFFPGLIVIGAFAAFLTLTAWKVLFGMIVVILAFNLHERRWAFGLTILLIVLFRPLMPWQFWQDQLLVERNFYGIHTLRDEGPLRILKHGTTVHGAQARGTEFETTPITYYYKESGADDVFSLLATHPDPQHVAAMGLGSGSVACFTKPGRTFDFYEIDPSIVAVAENPEYFTYLTKCGKGNTKILLGDARQKIVSAPDQSYDLIFIDVFSSDNIPIHVITTEAVALYRQKLKPDGVILFHTSNRFFNLEPEIAAIGQALDLPYIFKTSQGGRIGNTEMTFYPTKYVFLTTNQDILRSLSLKKWGKLPFEVNQEPWSDDYANVLRALRF